MPHGAPSPLVDNFEGDNDTPPFPIPTSACSAESINSGDTRRDEAQLNILASSHDGFPGNPCSRRPTASLYEVLPPSSSPPASSSSSETREMDRFSSKSPTRFSTFSKTYIPSPLNATIFGDGSPASISHIAPRTQTPFDTKISRASSEDTGALRSESNSPSPIPRTRRGSMVLYKFIGLDDALTREAVGLGRTFRTNRDSLASLDQDTKYPRLTQSERGIVAYAFDPLVDDDEWDVDDGACDNEEQEEVLSARLVPWRLASGAALLLLVLCLLSLFLLYPVVVFHHLNERHWNIANNPFVNSTGQAEDTIVDARVA